MNERKLNTRGVGRPPPRRRNEPKGKEGHEAHVHTDREAKVVNLGEWSDDAPRALELHEPETTDLVVTLGFRH